MNRTLAAATAVAIAVASAYGGYRYARHSAPVAAAPAAPANATKDGRRVLYWHDPMKPDQKFDKPGKSPFMDMDLVPVYADEAGEMKGGIAVSATAAQNLGVRIATAERGSLEPKLEAVGTVGFNERGVVVLQARSAGFVERLHARAPLDGVAKGSPLVEILVPDWAGAQEEFLLLAKKGDRELADASRRRLLLLGMSEAEIAAVERDGQPRARFTLHAPIGGVIAELGVREGMTVMPGQMLFKLVDLSSIWITAEVPEAQASWLKPGTSAQARVPAWPGQSFSGKVGAILPDVNTATRTVRARVEVSNTGGALKPGMFANLSIASGRGAERVLVASEAVIRTGERSVVIVAEEGRYRAVEVEIGQEIGGRSEVLRGLEAGQRVVASGQFLIDSEASLKGTLARLQPVGAAKHAGIGKVIALDAAKRRLELEHGPIPALKWPAMQMEFTVSDPAILQGVKPGDEVSFEMRAEQSKDGDWVIESLRPKAAPQPKAGP